MLSSPLDLVASAVTVATATAAAATAERSAAEGSDVEEACKRVQLCFTTLFRTFSLLTFLQFLPKVFCCFPRSCAQRVELVPQIIPHFCTSHKSSWIKSYDQDSHVG